MPYEVDLELYASGFASPVDIAHAGDDRLFVVERSGRIRILDANGNIMSIPFLDIDDRVHNAGNQSEQGLLGLAFHPNYASNGFFYVHYIANDDDSIIARFSRMPTNQNRALPSSEFQIMHISQPFINHNGGTLKFGPDGYLYIGMGDGGSANDPQNLAQNTQSLMGKMLRIDVDSGSPYSIPASNPFVGNPNVLDEIWSIGLRNPWKWSFDRMTGDMWIADVGQAEWEEINLQSAFSTGGENYGWRCFEGSNPFIMNGCNATYLPPLVEYNHQGFTHCSVTGGYVYRGPVAGFANFGVYFYIDYCSGRLWGTWLSGNFQINTEIFGDFPGMNISTFGEDVEGNHYAANISSGQIFRMEVNCKANQNCPLSVIVTEQQDASCFGVFDGSATVEVQDGNPPYDYDWPDGQSTATATGLTAFNYVVTVTDNDGNFGTASVTINQPNEIEINVVEEREITCIENGGAMISVNGDFPPFDVQWSTGTSGMQEFGITQAGPYTVMVTDANDCSSTLSIEIEEDTEVPAFTILGNKTLNCLDTCTILNPDFGGAAANVSWEWPGLFSSNEPTVPICEEGDYEIIVTNLDNGCTLSNSVSISEDKAAPQIINVNGIAMLDCAQIQSSLLVETANASDQFTWMDAQMNVVSTSALLQVSAPGIYNLTIQGANFCSTSSNYEITQNTEVPLAEAGPDKLLTCNTPTTNIGSAASSSGLIYQWTTLDGSLVGATDQPEVEVNAAGTYVLTVTNTDTQCSSSDEVIVEENFIEPIASISQDIDFIGCGAEVMTLAALDDVDYLFEWQDGSGNVLGNDQEQLVSEAGAYTLIVTDGLNGCSSSSSIEVLQVSPAPLFVNSPDVLTCENVTVELMAGTSATTCDGSYEWTGPDGFTSQDANVNVSIPGTYQVILTCASTGCTSEESIIVQEDRQSPSFTISSSGQLTCVNTMVDLEVPSPADWLSPNGQLSFGPSISVNVGGQYCATITDEDNGCTSTECITVTVNNELPTVDIPFPEALPCNGDPVTITAFPFSVNGPLDLQWSTVDGNILSGASTTQIQVDFAGTYCVTASDVVNGCERQVCVEVVLAESPTLELSGSQLLCFGEENGSIQTMVIGGSPPYTYAWSNGSSESNLLSLGAGVYELTVSDDKGCSDIQEISITEPAELILELVSTDETGSGFNDGTITPSVSGGVQPYTYSWSNGSTSNSLFGLSPGSYTLVLTDANGCELEALASIGTFGCELDFELVASNLSCFEAGDGSIAVNILSGTAPYNYLWSNQLTTESIEGLAAGKYTLQIIDASNCEKTVSIELLQPNELVATIITPQTINCNNGTAIFSPVVQGGTGEYSFTWFDGQTGSLVSFGQALEGVVFITDSNGCVVELDFEVFEDFNAPLGDEGGGRVFACETPTQALGFDLDPSLNLSYLWMGPDGFTANTPKITLTDGDCGEYFLRITDEDNGCFSEAEYFIYCEEDVTGVILEDTLYIDCINDSVSIIPLNLDEIGEDFDIAWHNLSTGQLIPEDEPILVVDECGRYQLTIVDPANSCSGQDSVEVVCDFESPIADAGPDQELACDITEVVIGGLSANENDTFIWRDMAGNFIGNTPTIVVTQCGVYTLEVIDAENGCNAFDEVEVICNDEVPIADAGENIVFQLDCISTTIEETVELDGTGSSQGPEFVYEWSVLVGSDGEIISGGITLMPTVAVPGAYSLTVTNTETGCTSSSMVVVSVNVTIDAPSFELETSFQNVDCDNPTIEVTVVVDIDNPSFLWIFPDGTTLDTQTIIVDSPGIYELMITDLDNGCESITQIQILPFKLSATIQTPNITSCLPGPVEVRVVADGLGPFTYLWSTGESTATIFAEPGEQVSVVVTDATGCEVTVQTTIPSVPPAMSLTSMITDALGQSNSGAIDIVVSGGSPPYEYNWSNGANTEDVADLEAGTYTVTITDANGCQLEQSFMVEMLVDVQSLKEVGIDLYPNPTQGQFHIRSEQELIEELKIYDESGKLFVTKTKLQYNEVHSFDLASGLYLVNIKTASGKTYAAKILVQQ